MSIIASGFVRFIIVHHWLKLLHLLHFRTRRENRLSRVYPASLRILMIYLAHSKAPSNETSSKRTQNSANSNIEQTFRHQRPKQHVFFVGPIYLSSQQDLLHPPDSSIVNHSISSVKFFENSEIS